MSENVIRTWENNVKTVRRENWLSSDVLWPMIDQSTFDYFPSVSCPFPFYLRYFHHVSGLLLSSFKSFFPESCRDVSTSPTQQGAHNAHHIQYRHFSVVVLQAQ